MDKSWVTLDRRSEEYRTKLNAFLDNALAKSTRKDKLICPCNRCCNRYYLDKVTVGGHLLWNGMDPLYMTACWTHHGEPYISPTNEVQLDPIDRGPMDLVNEGDEGSEMYGLLNESFVQPLIGENVGTSRQEPIFEGLSKEADTFYMLLKDADQVLYPGCKYKKLNAVLKLFQIKCLGNVTNAAFSEFLKVFKDMLPEGNCLKI